LLVEWDVEDLEDGDDHLLGGLDATTALNGPLLDTQELVVPHHRAEQLHTVFENLLHELLLLVCDQVVDKVKDPNKAHWGEVALRRDVHQKVHDLIIQFDLGHGLEELLFSLFVHPLVVKEVLGDALEEVERVVVVALAWAPVIDAVDEAHVSFLWQLDVN